MTAKFNKYLLGVFAILVIVGVLTFGVYMSMVGQYSLQVSSVDKGEVAEINVQIPPLNGNYQRVYLHLDKGYLTSFSDFVCENLTCSQSYDLNTTDLSIKEYEVIAVFQRIEIDKTKRWAPLVDYVEYIDWLECDITNITSPSEGQICGKYEYVDGSWAKGSYGEIIELRERFEVKGNVTTTTTTTKTCAEEGENCAELSCCEDLTCVRGEEEWTCQPWEKPWYFGVGWIFIPIIIVIVIVVIWLRRRK